MGQNNSTAHRKFERPIEHEKLVESRAQGFRYESWLSDAMPKLKKEYLVPVFDQETWDHMMQAIKEALEIWKEQVIKNALEPEPGRMIRNSEWDHETSEF